MWRAAIKKLARGYVSFRIYFGRGNGYIADFKNLAYFAVGFKIFGLGTVESVIVAIVCGMLIFTAGYIDIKKFGIMQFEAQRMSRFNPVLSKIEKNTVRRR